MQGRYPSSIVLWRWGGLTVRLHLCFVALVAATMYLTWPMRAAATVGVRPAWSAAGDLRGIALAAMAALFVGVVLHELAHWWVARRYGVPSDFLLIGPLGGLTPWSDTTRPGVVLAIRSAGPLAHLVVALGCGVALSVQAGSVVAGSHWNPLDPACFEPHDGLLVQGVRLVLWVNWLLFLVSLLPAHPFDGGHMVRAALRHWRPRWSPHQVDQWVSRFAVLMAGLMMVGALELWRRQGADTLFPIWLPLLMLGVIVLVGARHDVEVLGPGSGEVPREPQGPVGRAEKRTRPQRTRPRRTGSPESGRHVASTERTAAAEATDAEADEERQIDVILSRVHAHGMESLSAEERGLLQRASARYRSRMGKRT